MPPATETRVQGAPNKATAPGARAADPRAARAVFDEVRRQADNVLAMEHFFIVGCQKSGTTWLQGLLNGHPDIVCSGEARFATLLLQQLAQAARTYNEGQRMGEAGALSSAQVGQLFRTACAMVMSNWTQGRSVKFLGEKTPEHALAMGFLADAFPGCRFVHTIRDGRDGCVSGWFHNLRENPDTFAKRFPTFESYAAYFASQHYVRYIEAARAWGRANPERYTEVRYEQLHERPAEETARILAFLGADASKASVDACVAAGAFERVSGGRTRGEADNASHFRKGVVGDWRGHFTPEAERVFREHAGALMDELGYR